MNIIDDFKGEFSRIAEARRSVMRDLNEKKDQIIREAIVAAGLDPNDTVMLSTQMTLITQDGDPFEHLYYCFGTEKVKRVISFEKLTIDHMTEALQNDGKLRFELRYY